ncbi:trigger factor [Geopsychrobacter electrodiphilus]|uniref:trigger factor n=1 Tax=Geopsychrobacter electrodiphilus TaxID=225196 RepID=UPI0003730AB5|nr:trigger factor [Geopsychrobacter electrodiphilus]
MNITVEELGSIKKKLVVEISAEQVSASIEKAYRKIAKTASVKGFRKGKVPRRLLEQQYAPRMENDVVGSLVNDSLYKAMIDHNINPVSQPQVVESAPLEAGKPFTYEAEVEVRPEVVATGYAGLVLEKEKFTFDDSVVEERLKQLAESRSSLEVTSRKKCRVGDTVIIDFEGSIDGTAFENGSASDYQLELGSSSFIPGFEEQIYGMVRDEEREIEVSFPENYGSKELAGKPAKFKVLLKEIKEKISQKITDELATDVGFDDLKALRDRIREDSLREQTERVENQLQEKMMNLLVETNSFEVPEGMIQSQLEHLKKNFSQRLKSQGMTLEMLGMNDEGFSAAYRDMADNQVRGELILEAIAKQEAVTVDESELELKMEELAKQSNAELAQVKAYFSNPQAKEGLSGQILHEKVVSLIISQAKVTEVEPKPDHTASEVAVTEEKED